MAILEPYAKRVLGLHKKNVEACLVMFDQECPKGSSNKLESFRRLYNQDTGISRIYLADFSSIGVSPIASKAWFVIHEFVHLKQLITKELKLNKVTVTWRGKRYHIKPLKSTPWERAPRLIADNMRNRENI